MPAVMCVSECVCGCSVLCAVGVLCACILVSEPCLCSWILFLPRWKHVDMMPRRRGSEAWLMLALFASISTARLFVQIFLAPVFCLFSLQ